MVQQAPVYLIVLQYAQMVVQLLYPVLLVVILFLAWLDFRRWVNHVAPKKKAKAGEA